MSRRPTAVALTIFALLALPALALATPAAGQTGCETPEVCATVSLDREVYTASLYGTTGTTRVTATGVIHVEAQIGHFVELDVTVTGVAWQMSITPTHIRLQTPADIPFTATVHVPAEAKDGAAAFEVRVDDDDRIFPIHSTGTFQVAVFRGPLALFSAPATDAPRPGDTATWRLTVRNLATFEIDYNPVFEVPPGFETRAHIPATQLLDPGGEAEVVFDLEVPAGAQPGEFAWSVLFESQTHPEVSVALTQPFAVRPLLPPASPGSDDLLARYWLPLALGTIALGAILVFSLTEVGYLALAFSFIVPLFTRLRSDKVLDNFTRGQIYGYIRANPGAHYSELHHILEVKNGVLAYHLRVLMREEYIVARSEGVYKRFYPRDYKIPRRRRILTRLQADILEAVEGEPGMTQRALARTLGESRQVVSYNVRVLREAGLLRTDRPGRGAIVEPSPDGTRAVAEARAARAGVEAGEPDAA